MIVKIIILGSLYSILFGYFVYLSVKQSKENKGVIHWLLMLTKYNK